MKQYIRKADIILFIVLVAAGLAASAALSMSHSAAGSDARVVIKSGGELFATYPLSKDTVIEVPAPAEAAMSDGAAASEAAGSEGAASEAEEPEDASSSDDVTGGECTQYSNYNIVEISGGSVSVTKASCKNQVCVRHGKISHTGESIVCLPNRLVVTIEGGGKEGGGYDSVTS